MAVAAWFVAVVAAAVAVVLEVSLAPVKFVVLPEADDPTDVTAWVWLFCVWL